jgi:Met-zincin/Domain of unknown function (DUF5117)/Domain of unknown function (DUF5118)
MTHQPTAILAAVLVLLSGCANLKKPAVAEAPKPAAATPVAAAASAASPFASAPPTAARPDPAAPRPFADVIKGATQQAGFVPIWRKDDKLWLEIPAERLDQPFMLSVNISHSVGERGLYASQMGPSWLASFRKINNTQIQLVALNTNYVATGNPMKAAVEQAFSDSLLASAAIASAPHPERKSVLIDGAFLLSDIAGYSTRLEAAFRIPFGLDRANSFFEKTRAADDITTLNARMHYATPRIPAPPLVAGPVPTPPPPLATADPRSFFIGYVYSFTKLPEQPMAVRRADPRLGHFTDVVTDLSTDLKVNPRLHYVNRWRLEKADPQAALSEPKQPIVFWLDRNIPAQYRAAVEAGVLEWNKAFEKVGFRNALVAKQQPDDADWDDMDARHASIRWFTGADVGFAIGPSHSDPRTGEIIDADIGMSDVFGRSARRFYVEDVGRSAMPAFAQPMVLPGFRHDRQTCQYAHENAAEMDFALDLIEARGDLPPDSPQTEVFVQSVIKDTVMHEVGHVLGLKHNFKSSTVFTRAQLQDREFTEKNGISGSVMDYTGYNVAAAGERQGAYRNGTLGPYDYWAIEYAYKPIAPADEAAELARIAGRSTEPWLAFADDADAGEGIDPLVNRFDLGDDPLAYYRKRLQLSRELWQRVQDRGPQPGDEATRQRRVLLSGFNALGRSTELIGKYVGGMHTTRDLPGTTGRAAYVPVEPAKQREALKVLATGLFATDSFQFKPQFLASLSPDYNEWNRGGPVNIPAAVLQLQTTALDRLLSPGTAARVLDLPLYVPAERQRGMISLNEVYSTVQGTVWSELKSGREIDRLRRNLQREHLKRLQALLTRGSAALPADALSLMRLNATELLAELKQASGKPGLSVESRAHLQDSLSALTEALRASMLRG